MGIMINPEVIRDYEHHVLHPIKQEPRMMSAAQCGEFLGISAYWLRKRIFKTPGFPVKMRGRFALIREDELFDWLYGHPEGIKWRQHWDKLGRLKKMNWRFLK